MRPYGYPRKPRNLTLSGKKVKGFRAVTRI